MCRIGRAAAPVLVALLGLTVVPAVGAQGLHLIPNVLEISVDTLPDVAIAAVDAAEPVIYYNPGLMRRYGPYLATFFLAHEYGHLYYRHTRTGLVAPSEAARDSILRRQELEADCYATRQLGARDRRAVEAAIRFFTRLGPFRFDAVHPTGAQRATRILACLPVQWTGGFLVPPGETGVETGPVSGSPDPARFQVQAPAIGEDDYGKEIRLTIDGRAVGRVSNMRGPNTLEVTSVPAGMHSYRVSVDLYGLDSSLQFSPGGTVTGTGYISVTEGDRFEVRWSIGNAPRLVKEREESRGHHEETSAQ